MLLLDSASCIGFHRPRELRMKKTNGKSKNFVDALATDLQFAVLTKRGRVQILVKPSAKELRKRGKRGWQLFVTLDDQTAAPPLHTHIFNKPIYNSQIL